MKIFSLNTQEYEIQLLPKVKYQAQHTPQNSVIGFAYEIQHGHHAFASDRITPYYSTPNSLAFTPKGCDIFSTSEEGGEYLVIRIKSNELEKKQIAPHQFNDHIDQKAITSAYQLRRIILSENGNPLELEEIINTLIGAVIKKTTGKSQEPAGKNSITRKRLKSLHNYIEANLSENITLNQLAITAGLSKSFFIRAFKAATGQPPHKYLLSRRISRATQLIWENNLRLTQISLECGFNSHSHMTTVFRRTLGVTPRYYRGITKK